MRTTSTPIGFLLVLALATHLEAQENPVPPAPPVRVVSVTAVKDGGSTATGVRPLQAVKITLGENADQRQRYTVRLFKQNKDGDSTKALKSETQGLPLGTDKTIVMTVPVVRHGVYRLEVCADGAATPLPSDAPPLTVLAPDAAIERVDGGIRANSVFRLVTRGLVAPRDKVKLWIGRHQAKIVDLDPAGTWMTAETKKPFFGRNALALVVEGIPVRGLPPKDKPGASAEPIMVTVPWDMPWELCAIIALVPLALVIGILWLVLRQLGERRVNDPDTRPYMGKLGTWLGLLLVDPQTATYSLARAQALTWLAVIAYAYAFLFLANYAHAGEWAFPTLKGAGYTLLISLSTLCLAEGTAAVAGPKGAGDPTPAISDLFVHGGVLALERVQQVVWTIIGASAFLLIVLGSYGDVKLPEIPNELLMLMGISSAGYVTGKMTRGAGPVVERLEFPDSVTVVVRGQHFAQNAAVSVDEIEISRDLVSPEDFERAGDRDSPVQTLRIGLPPTLTGGLPLARRWTVTVRNPDAQLAKWATMPVIESASLDAANTLVIRTRFVDSKAKWDLSDAVTPQQDLGRDPAGTVWTATVPATWAGTQKTLRVTSGTETATFDLK